MHVVVMAESRQKRLDLTAVKLYVLGKYYN